LQTGPERHLVALKKALDAARATAAPAAADVLAEAGEELDRARMDLDELAGGLQPPALAGQGLEAALAELASHASVPVDLRVVTPELPQRLEAAVYFVCSEALANVAKHAEATRAGLEMSLADGCVRVRVWDDGRGGADPAAGSGLRGLGERVIAAGGQLRVESPPGAGTQLLAELPLSGQ
jgi:signal transduction histidine kinase